MVERAVPARLLFAILKVNALGTARSTLFRIIAYSHYRLFALKANKANTEVAEQTDCGGGDKAYEERGESEIFYFSHAGAQPK